MTKNSVKSNLLVLYLSLGCIVWFANFTLGSLKSILLVLVIITRINIFLKKTSYINLGVFFFFILIVTISFQLSSNNDNSTSKFSLYYTYILNYIFYIFGHYYARSDLLNIFHMEKIIYVIVPLCLLTILNFIFGYPNWYAPNVVEHFNNMERLGYHVQLTTLHSSGFGLGRTGWATSLLQFLPICLFFIFQKKNKLIGIISYIIILFSIMISGSRGGFFYSVLLTLIIINTVVSKRKAIFISLLSILFLVTLLNKPDFISFFRLDSSDITAGRGIQYLLAPEMIKQAGLFGLGIDGSYHFSLNYLIDHSLHNIYIRLLIDYGWILGGVIIIVILRIIFRILRLLLFNSYKGDKYIYISTFIIIGGLLAGMTEPGAIFEARSWWVIWWFALGIFTFNYNKLKNDKYCNDNN